ncbi:MAG: TonB-dependent receptor [Rhodothermales bacterium]|nr:TonB-dependent receptor [Rhodothermales bacterium]
MVLRFLRRPGAVLGILLMFPFAAHAQRAGLGGVIVSHETGAPLPGINVYLDGAGVGDISGRNGAYAIDGALAGRYLLVAHGLGFETFRDSISLSPGETRVQDIRLAERPVDLDEIVVERLSMTGGYGGVLDIPGAAHYIGPRELETFSFNDIHRILRQVPGVHVQDEDGFGLRPNIGMRGTGSERSSKITVMEDGILMAPAPYAAPAAYYFPTAGRMEGVEVRKGSSQIKYGPYTTGGAINLISTQIPDRFVGRLDALAGTRDDRTLHATIGHTIGRVGFLVETYQAQSDGFKSLETGGSTGFDKKDLIAKLRFTSAPRARVYQSLTLKAGLTDERSDETYLGLTEADFAQQPYLRYAGSQEDVMDAAHSHFTARHVIRPTDKIDLTTTLYRTNFERNWYKLDRVQTAADGFVSITDVLDTPEAYGDAYNALRGTPAADDHLLEVKNNNRTYYGQGVQSILGITLPGGRALHEVEVGLRFHQDEEDRFQWSDLYRMEAGVAGGPGQMVLTEAGTPGTESNRISQARALAAHVQYRLSAGRLTVTPGARLEHIELSRDDYGRADPQRTGSALTARTNRVDAFMPGIGIDRQIGVNGHLFAGIHKGFAPPDSREGTRPEQSVNYEFGGRYRRGVTGAEAVVYFSDYSNLLGVDLAAAGGQGTIDQFNGGEVNAYGLEVSAEHPIAPEGSVVHFPIRISYTLSRAVFQNSFDSDFEAWGGVAKGDELPYLPRHRVSLIVAASMDRATVSLGAAYADRMRTRAGQSAFIDRESTDAHLVLDVSGEFTVSPNLRLFASVRNVTDQAYIVARRPAGIRPGLPRTAIVGLKTTF